MKRKYWDKINNNNDDDDDDDDDDEDEDEDSISEDYNFRSCFFCNFDKLRENDKFCSKCGKKQIFENRVMKNYVYSPKKNLFQNDKLYALLQFKIPNNQKITADVFTFNFASVPFALR